MSEWMQVHAKPKAAAEQIQYIVDWIAATYPNGESGIVYCLTRKDTEQVAAELAQHGIACGCYHADMDPVPRESVHMQWSSGAASLTFTRQCFMSRGPSESEQTVDLSSTMHEALDNLEDEGYLTSDAHVA